MTSNVALFIGELIRAESSACRWRLSVCGLLVAVLYATAGCSRSEPAVQKPAGATIAAPPRVLVAEVIPERAKESVYDRGDFGSTARWVRSVFEPLIFAYDGHLSVTGKVDEDELWRNRRTMYEGITPVLEAHDGDEIEWRAEVLDLDTQRVTVGLVQREEVEGTRRRRSWPLVVQAMALVQPDPSRGAVLSPIVLRRGVDITPGESGRLRVGDDLVVIGTLSHLDYDVPQDYRPPSRVYLILKDIGTPEAKAGVP